MEKEQLLTELSNLVTSGQISREEVMRRIGSREVVEQKKHRNFSVTKIFYFIGGAIVVTGVIFFIAQVWNDIGSFGRIAVTLCLGILFAISGSILLNTKPENSVGQIFHGIGGLIIPGGAIVMLWELSPESLNSFWTLGFLFSILFIFYIILTFVHKREVITFFALANGTTAVYLFTVAILESSPTFYRSEEEVFAYLTMVIGAMLILLAYGFRNGWNRRLVPILNLFGSVGFFSAAFSQVFDSLIWQLLFVFLALGGTALSTRLRSSAMLAVSTLALIVHIIYITSEYFADSIGWPVSLVVLGFVVIGLGYGSVAINKKFISRKSRLNT